ncbi:unnamed protein product [Miscanthus lutarioriparius]|uniref:Uncharacterized protein n=1 Tax=Miscanthus lutarioriparius TaxID=422564 RepID=A0A811MUZ5_9POAL|nr:unnamed protein product [Miscanthus lutarioriparius]
MQVTDDRPEPSLALSLRVGSEEEPQPQPQNRLRHAPTRQSPSLLSRPAGSSVPPQTYYAPASSPAGAGLAPQLQLGSNSLPLPLPLGATPPSARAALRRVQPPLRSFGGGLAEKGERGPRSHSQGGVAAPGAERRGEKRGPAAPCRRRGGSRAGVPLPAAAFSAAGLPQPQQPCGGAWRWCPACGARAGTVVLKPYEHICLCAQCSDASRLCLHCYCSFTWTGAVEAASRGRGRGCGRGGL